MWGSLSRICCLPQWSPSLADGTTVRDRRRPEGPQGAAMEPVLGGRDDVRRGRATAVAGFAAMEPVLGGRDDLARTRAPHQHRQAAMEPVLGGRDDWPGGALSPGHCSPQWSPSLADGTTSTSSPSGRRSRRKPQWSPSLADGTTPGIAYGDDLNPRPQWSPSLADGTTVNLPFWYPSTTAAAMEPVLGGRDDRPISEIHRAAVFAPQWSPSLADGTTCGCRTTGVRLALRRNGARPWRTGRPAACPGADRGDHDAAMEPVLGGRDDAARIPIVNSANFPPQWSPSLADGTTRPGGGGAQVRAAGRNGARPWRTGRRYCETNM